MAIFDKKIQPKFLIKTFKSIKDVLLLVLRMEVPTVMVMKDGKPQLSPFVEALITFPLGLGIAVMTMAFGGLVKAFFPSLAGYYTVLIGLIFLALAIVSFKKGKTRLSLILGIAGAFDFIIGLFIFLKLLLG